VTGAVGGLRPHDLLLCMECCGRVCGLLSGALYMLCALVTLCAFTRLCQHSAASCVLPMVAQDANAVACMDSRVQLCWSC
jgi:hypothetical protein